MVLKRRLAQEANNTVEGLWGSVGEYLDKKKAGKVALWRTFLKAQRHHWYSSFFWMIKNELERSYDTINKKFK